MQFNNAAIAACSFGTSKMQFTEIQGYIYLQKFSNHATIVMKKYDYLNALGVHPVK